LKKLLEAQSCLKIFHFGRFDITFLHQYLGIKVNPVFCTKISSKLLRTYTDRHSLKDLVKEYLGVELSKADQCSDWAREDLSESQLDYAANDVRVLIPIHEIMSNLLVRENLTDLAQAAFKSLPLICEFDRRGYKDVFEH
jgi:ribonuclease D